MHFFSSLSQFFNHNLFFITWQDAIEIFFFSWIIYHFSRWLNKDKKNNLVFYFYGYCLLAFGSYYAQLSTISTFLFICAPVAVTIFIFVHQETLQKNFIALRNVQPAKRDATDWLETFIRTCLVTINNNKEILCVMEHRDSLAQLITTPLSLEAEIEKNLLTMILASNSYEPSKIMWITSTGIIRGINASWNTELEEQWLSEEVKKLHKWKQDALFFTSKTDALVFKITPEARLFEFVAESKSYDQVSAHQLLTMVKKYITFETSNTPKRKVPHDLTTPKSSKNQRNA